jgi:hypothetical protein
LNNLMSSAVDGLVVALNQFQLESQERGFVSEV